MQLDDVHDTNSCLFLECVTSATIKELNFTIPWEASFFKLLLNNFVWYAIKWWCGNLVPECFCSHTEMSLKELTKVHTAWNTKWVQNDVNWGTVFHEWHVFFWQNTCDN